MSAGMDMTVKRLRVRQAIDTGSIWNGNGNGTAWGWTVEWCQIWKKKACGCYLISLFFSSSGGGAKDDDRANLMI